MRSMPLYAQMTGIENPCPSGPRRFRRVPGIQAESKSGAERNPFGAESLKKTGTANGESDPLCVGEEILSGSGNQFGRANDPRAGIQINFMQLTFTNFHLRNVNTLRGHKQESYNHKNYVSEETMNISTLLKGLRPLPGSGSLACWL